MSPSSAITITFGDGAENHRGMEVLSNGESVPFERQELEEISRTLEAKGYETVIKDLNDALSKGVDADDACLLIVRKVLPNVLDFADRLRDVIEDLEWDKKAKMYGRVVDKKARHNLCFDDEGQEPDYEEGKGRIVAFRDVPLLAILRRWISRAFRRENLVAEGNLYYDVNTCGIGFHGDGERNVVIALRLGETIPLQYQWFLKGEAIGERIEIDDVEHGDLYVMSRKAVGKDWKTKNVPTLRHAAGSSKFTTIS